MAACCSILGQAQVRLYEWVDLNQADITLDPVEVGSLVGAIHRVRFAGKRPVDPGYPTRRALIAGMR